MNRLLEKAEDEPELAFVAVLLLILVAFMATVIVLAARSAGEMEEQCHRMGGHVVSRTHPVTGTGIGPNGQPVVTTGTSTTTFCLSPDGRVLEVW